MSIKKYNAFVKIVETGSITKAAALLGHTQSGVTQLLNSLEDDLKVKLLIRSRAGIELTDEGKALLPKIREVLATDAEVRALAENLQKGNKRTIRIGAFTSAAVEWLPNLIRDYQQIDSTVHFEVLDCGYNEIEDALAKKKADFFFAPLPLSMKCRIIPLLSDPLLAIVPSGHMLSQKEKCPISAFETEPVLGLLPAINRDAQSVYETNRIVPNIKYTVEDDYAMIAMVGKGLGIAIVPGLMISGNKREDITVLPLDPPASRTIGLAFPPDVEERPEVKQFTEFIKARLETN